MLSGKFYYDLLKERTAKGLADEVALVRVEELSPFPFSELREILQTYPSDVEYVWAQEEPRNQGAWTHVQERINNVLSEVGMVGSRVQYVGRRESALPAPGVGILYQAQQKQAIADVFTFPLRR